MEVVKVGEVVKVVEVAEVVEVGRWVVGLLGCCVEVGCQVDGLLFVDISGASGVSGINVQRST